MHCVAQASSFVRYRSKLGSMYVFRSVKLWVLACVCALSGLSYAQAQPSGQRYTEEYTLSEDAVPKMKGMLPASIRWLKGC